MINRWLNRSRQQAAPGVHPGLMARLRSDKRGNTLAVMAIALIPLTGLVGSAVDTARVYYVKSRLQQACDAGALAGRKFMNGDTFTAAAQTNANTFFDNNFKDGVFGSTGRTRTYTRTSDSQVQGVATVNVPMTLMKIFQAPDVPLTATCLAKLEVPNLDVMFVLDTTGSMGETNPGDTVNRITALRSSVMDFYDTLEASKAATSQIRYGFVPYANTVNVGLLLKKDWLVDSWTYQSREPGDITQVTSTTTQGQWITTYSSWTRVSGSVDYYVTYGDPEDCGGSAPANTATTTTTYTGWVAQPNGSQTRTTTQVINGSTYSASLSNGVCTITESRYNNYRQQRTDTQTPNPNAGQTTTTTSNRYWWLYKPVTFNVSTVKGSSGTTVTGGTVVAMINGGNTATWANRNITWNASNACIEERDTVRETDYSAIPTGAFDMNIDMVPTAGNPATQWRPFIPVLVYARAYTTWTNPSVVTSSWPSDITTPVRYNGNYANLSNYPNDYGSCPTAARKLATMTRSTLNSYMNSLKVAGRTYHDIGFLWGLRLLSAEGLFASENTSAPNGSAIARHVIFMTDGQTETNFADYDAYGLAALDRRRTPVNRLPSGNGETDQIVENRLAALCQAAQRKNMTVWVIAFGTTLSPLLSDCASPGGHSFQANNAADLNDAFAQIASNIAKLRLSQ